MKFIVLWLTYLLCFVNLKYAACSKCDFIEYSDGYACKIIPDSSSIEEKHADGKTDDNVKTILFQGNNNEDLTQSDLGPICQRLKNVVVVFIRNIKSVSGNSLEQCKN